MAFRNYYAEMELPTVIIDMPELQRIASRKKAQHAIMYILAALTFVGLSGLIYLELTAQTKEVVKAETLEVKDDASGSLKLTVKLAPQNVVGAVVEVDGEVISGNPPYVYIEPSEEYHSIKISAPGYEVMSKDVQVTASEVMTFSLIAKDSTKLADNSDIDASDDTDRLSDSDFEPNSDDLIEEIEDGDFGTRLSGQEKRRGKGRLAGPGGKVGGVAAGRHGKGGRDDSGSAIRSVSVSFGPSPSQPAASAGGMTSAMQSSP
ncbi:MAG: PEGA domain-containing protein, partial [Deltaproteobacteria bacterium]|nr:PEGA domain-containing protein [Deltaproteobacteria bacterium]